MTRRRKPSVPPLPHTPSGSSGPERRLPENGGLRQAMEDIRRRLDEVDTHLGKIEERQYEQVQAIAALRVQSGVWGGLSGLIAATAALITTFLMGRSN